MGLSIFVMNESRATACVKHIVFFGPIGESESNLSFRKRSPNRYAPSKGAEGLNAVTELRLSLNRKEGKRERHQVRGQVLTCVIKKVRKGADSLDAIFIPLE